MKKYLFSQSNRINQILLFLGALFLSHLVFLENLINIDGFGSYVNPILYNYQWFFSGADILLLIVFLLFIRKNFKLTLTDNPFTKRKLLVFLLGLVGLAVLIGFHSIFSADFSYYDMQNQFNPLQQSLQYPAVKYISIMLISPLLGELIYRDLFFGLFFQKENKLNHFFLIFISGLISLLMWLLGAQVASPADMAFTALSGWLFAAVRFYSKDVKLPIVLHILLNIYLLW